MTTDTTLDDLADEKFVSLTTFRKNGVGVPTPVWIGRDGDALVVTTPVGSGKVKRLRRNCTVELRPFRLARTAQTLNSGMRLMGSSAGLVSRSPSASASVATQA